MNTDKFEKEIEYLLRRLEYNIDYEKSLNTLFEYIPNVDIDRIYNIIFRGVVKKDVIANILAVELYNREKYIYSLNLLNFAYDFNNLNKDVLLNIPNVMDKIGIKDQSLLYLYKYLNAKYSNILFNLRKDEIN